MKQRKPVYLKMFRTENYRTVIHGGLNNFPQAFPLKSEKDMQSVKIIFGSKKDGQKNLMVVSVLFYKIF